MNHHGIGRRHHLAVVAAAVLLALTGCSAAGSEPAPSPSSGAPAPAETTAAAPSDDAAAEATDAPASDAPAAAMSMPASTPVSISIPALDRTSDLIETGMRADGTLEVPPGAEGSPASWYDGSPTPGEVGSSVILGHVNSLSDESGVFFQLDTLEAGDQVSVTREDGSTAVFEIYRLASFAKDEFPTRDVYFPVPEAELRLITCDDLDEANGLFPNNTVVFAKLVDEA